MMIIDPPSDFAPLCEWQEFLIDMQGLERNTDDNDLIQRWIKEAKKQIAARAAGKITA